MYGILDEKRGKSAVHNKIFETLLLDYLLAQEKVRDMVTGFTSGDKSQLVCNIEYVPQKNLLIKLHMI